MKIEKLKPGMVVYDVRRERMGNTTIKTVAVRPVKIIEVDREGCFVIASWNYNAPRKFVGSAFAWRLKEPMLIRGRMGYARLATPEEIKAAKLAEGEV